MSENETVQDVTTNNQAIDAAAAGTTAASTEAPKVIRLAQSAETNRESFLSARKLCLLAVFTALMFVTEYYLSFTIGMNYRISLTFLIRAIAGFTLGPLACLASGFSDILGGYLLYAGNMILGITAVSFGQGATDGLILHKKSSVVRIVSAAFVDTILWNIPCVYFRFKYLGRPFTKVTITPQIVISCGSLAACILIMLLMRKRLLPAIRRLLYDNSVWRTSRS